MVAKKKGLYLGLLLSLLAIGKLTAKEGYKFLFANNTPYRLKFIVHYHGRCEPDFKEVEHKSIGKLESNKLCSIKQFVVVAYDKHIIPRIGIREKKIRAEIEAEIEAKKSIMRQFYEAYDEFMGLPENIRAETNTDEKLQRPEVVLSKLFAPGHFSRDKTIIIAVGEPTNLFKVRHWQITPTVSELSEEEFIRLFPRAKFRFEEYISAFGWREDLADEESDEE